MRGDAFADFQHSTGAAQSVLTTALATDHYDQLAARDIGDGGGLQLVTTTPVAATPTWVHKAVSLTDSGDLVGFLTFTTVDADVNTGTDVITETAHKLVTGDPLYVTSSGSYLTTSPAGLLNAGVKAFAIRVDANTFKVATTRANALAGVAIDITANTGGATLTWVVPHELPVGTPVVLDTISGTTGATAGTIYYTSFSSGTSNNLVVLAPTLADALLGTNIVALTTNGTANLTALSTLEVQLLEGSDSGITQGVEIIATSGPLTCRVERQVSFTAGTDVVNLAGHGMSTGTPFKLSVTGSGVLPTASPTLIAGQTYYAIPVDANTFRIALTKADAAAGAYVDLTGAGTAEVHVKIADDLLAAGGPPIVLDISPRPLNTGERYVRPRYVVANGALLACSVRSKFHITGGGGSAPKRYPIGYEVKT